MLTGVAVAASCGVGPRALGSNLAAWLVGAGLGAAVFRWGGARTRAALVSLALLALGLTFLAPGLQGVHRWIQAGPIRLNAAQLLGPVFVVVLAAWDWRRAAPWLAGGASLILLAGQPDASQAAAVGMGLALGLGVSPIRPGLRALGLLAIAAAVALARVRPDPLSPVPEVEEILLLAFRLSPAVSGLAGLVLACASLAPLTLARGPGPARTGGLALAGYAGVAAVAPFAGAFPTPLLGMGVSPILGLWLGVAVLAGLAAAPDARPSP